MLHPQRRQHAYRIAHEPARGVPMVHCKSCVHGRVDKVCSKAAAARRDCALIWGALHSQIFGWPRLGGLVAIGVWQRKL